MNNICWEVFKKTGSIEAYLYITQKKEFTNEIELIRENDDLDDNTQHPGDCT